MQTSTASAQVEQLPIAPVTYCGFQEGFGRVAGFHLWNLTAPVGIHPVRSTVDSATLIRHGYQLPAIPQK